MKPKGKAQKAKRKKRVQRVKPRPKYTAHRAKPVFLSNLLRRRKPARFVHPETKQELVFSLKALKKMNEIASLGKKLDVEIMPYFKMKGNQVKDVWFPTNASKWMVVKAKGVEPEEVYALVHKSFFNAFESLHEYGFKHEETLADLKKISKGLKEHKASITLGRKRFTAEQIVSPAFARALKQSECVCFKSLFPKCLKEPPVGFEGELALHSHPVNAPPSAPDIHKVKSRDFVGWIIPRSRKRRLNELLLVKGPLSYRERIVLLSQRLNYLVGELKKKEGRFRLNEIRDIEGLFPLQSFTGLKQIKEAIRKDYLEKRISPAEFQQLTKELRSRQVQMTVGRIKKSLEEIKKYKPLASRAIERKIKLRRYQEGEITKKEYEDFRDKLSEYQRKIEALNEELNALAKRFQPKSAPKLSFNQLRKVSLKLEK